MLKLVVLSVGILIGSFGSSALASVEAAADTFTEATTTMSFDAQNDADYLESFTSQPNAAMANCMCMCRYNSSTGLEYRFAANGLNSANYACAIAKAMCHNVNLHCHYGNHLCGCQ